MKGKWWPSAPKKKRKEKQSKRFLVTVRVHGIRTLSPAEPRQSALGNGVVPSASHGFLSKPGRLALVQLRLVLTTSDPDMGFGEGFATKEHRATPRIRSDKREADSEPSRVAIKVIDRLALQSLVRQALKRLAAITATPKDLKPNVSIQDVCQCQT